MEDFSEDEIDISTMNHLIIVADKELIEKIRNEMKSADQSTEEVEPKWLEKYKNKYIQDDSTKIVCFNVEDQPWEENYVKIMKIALSSHIIVNSFINQKTKNLFVLFDQQF